MDLGMCVVIIFASAAVLLVLLVTVVLLLPDQGNRTDEDRENDAW